MVPPSPLDDPQIATHAWTRYRRVLRGMAWFTLAVVLVACALIYAENGFVSIHLYVAAALGVGLTMLMAAALMGLIFLSNGTGHDDAVADPLRGYPED